MICPQTVRFGVSEYMFTWNKNGGHRTLSYAWTPSVYKNKLFSQIKLFFCDLNYIRFYNREFIVSFWSGEGTCSPNSEVNALVPLFPQIKILISYIPCSPILPLFLCSLIFRPLFLCSPEIKALVPQNPWEGLILTVQKTSIENFDFCHRHGDQVFVSNYAFVVNRETINQS